MAAGARDCEDAVGDLSETYEEDVVDDALETASGSGAAAAAADDAGTVAADVSGDAVRAAVDSSCAECGIVQMQARARGMLARKHDAKELAAASTVTKAEAKAERQRALGKDTDVNVVVSESTVICGSDVKDASSSSSRAPRPLKPPPIASSVFPSVPVDSAAIDNDHDGLPSARSLRHSIDEVMRASAEADALAEHTGGSSPGAEEDSLDASQLALAVFSAAEVVPHRPNAQAVPGAHKRSPRFDLVAGKSDHSKLNAPPPASLAYSSPLVAAPSLPAATRIPKLRSRFPVVSKPSEAASPVQRPQWLIDEENRRQEDEAAAAKRAAERRQALQKSNAITDALRQSKAKETEALKLRHMEGVRKQRSEDNVPGDGGEHPFIQESIEKSTALRKASGYEAGVKNVSVDAAHHDDGATMQPAAVESSCDSIGSKSKPHLAPLEVVPEDVLSFEQRRKEILRLTREAEERKKRRLEKMRLLMEREAKEAEELERKRKEALLEAEEMRKNELQRRVEDLHRRLEEQREKRLSFERAEQQKLKQRGKPLFKKIEAAYEQNVVMPELEHRREVLKKLRQQFEPIDLKQIAKEWDENHPVDAVRKKFKTGGNGHANQDASAFAGLPSIYRGPAFMRAIEEKHAAKFAKQKEHQKAFDKLRKQREYAENVRLKAKEMLEKLKDARGEPKVEVLSSDVIAARLKQGVKLPPVAARQLREEARGAAIEKLSSRRAETDRISVSMAVEVHEDHTSSVEGPSSYRSSGSGKDGAVGASDLRDERPGLGFISPEYAEDFDVSSHDAVAQHVNAFLAKSCDETDAISGEDTALVTADCSREPATSDGEDLARSQEFSLQALRGMQSYQHTSLPDPHEKLPDTDVRDSSKRLTGTNPYADLYSSDVLADTSLREQSPQHQSDIAGAHLEKDARDAPSRGSDTVSESQSVADEVGSNGFGNETLAEEGF